MMMTRETLANAVMGADDGVLAVGFEEAAPADRWDGKGPLWRAWASWFSSTSRYAPLRVIAYVMHNGQIDEAAVRDAVERTRNAGVLVDVVLCQATRIRGSVVGAGPTARVEAMARRMGW